MLSRILIDGLLLTAAFSVVVLPSLWFRPRLWLHDFPADIQARVPPKSASEQQQTRVLGVIFFAVLLSVQFALIARLQADLGAALTPVGILLYVYGVFFIVNLIDLVVIDWGGFTLIDPQNPPLPGTEGAAGWRDYAFHWRGFLKGLLIGVGYALVITAAYLLVSAIF
jgi:hypothetical protein